MDTLQYVLLSMCAINIAFNIYRAKKEPTFSSVMSVLWTWLAMIIIYKK